ncbi:major facilitator superfamily domain-containing protein [Amylocarpus encephaloides]|uniref:Major facilitator superfamily domain-containing protein n=1 Tax=Amylocarpus encephaloides TaxID=45428 RepID=A0A9P7YQ49_9HELO|nr:major facilitator superfamily domain-containing protein [Amylocarpus encephaloides]
MATATSISGIPAPFKHASDYVDGGIGSSSSITLEDGLKFKDVPITFSGNGNLTSGRKAAVSAILILCNSLIFMSFGACVGGGFGIGRSLGVYDPTTTAWIAAAYPLTQGAFVLVTGRIGSVYGHKNVLLLGGVWWTLCSLVNGFCTQSLATFAVARAFSGIGAAMVMPNVIATIGITFPPGPWRNYSFGFLGFGAPVAGTAGTAVIAAFMEFVHWKWFFFCITILGALLFTALWAILPHEEVVDKEGTVDWIGAVLGISALITFNFVWNQAPAVGWSEIYILIALVVSIALFINFAIFEHAYATSPILPLKIFKAPSFFPLCIVILLTIMSYSTALWYLVAFQQLIRHWTPLHFAAGLTPHAIFGGLAAPVASFLVPRIAAQYLLAFGALSVMLSAILLATMPEQQSYWCQVFPATILMAVCSDFVFTAAQIIATGAVGRKDQGAAGSLVSLLQLYGASIGLGVAGTVEGGFSRGGRGDVRGYRGALWAAVIFASIAVVVDGVWVRVKRDERVGWEDEETELK